MSAAGWTVHRIPRAWATRALSVPRQACQVPSCAVFVNVFHCEREGVGKGVDRPVSRQFEGTLSDLTQCRLVQCRRKREVPFCRGTESKERKGHSECKNLRREHFCGGELEPTRGDSRLASFIRSMVAVAKEHSNSGFTHITDKRTAWILLGAESSSPDAFAAVGPQRANISISFFRLVSPLR
jgi:hypothetical protein